MTETDWLPDHRTIHDFMELTGEEGVRFINEYAVEWGEEELADPKVLVADTTAREYHLFAKTKELKDKIMTEMVSFVVTFVEQVNERLAAVVTAAGAKRERRLSKYARLRQTRCCNCTRR